MTVALRLLVDRRDGLGHARTDLLNRIHKLLLELLPGGAKKFLSADQARTLLNTIRPRDLVGRTRRRLASELISDLVAVDKKIKAANKELTELVEATGSSLQDLNGIGPSGAARLIGDIGDIHRFASRAHFASWNGTAPLDASSGDQKNGIACRGPATGASTVSCTSWPSSSCATTHPAAPTTGAGSPRARRRWKPCAASNDDCPMWSIDRCSATQKRPRGRAREDKWGRLCNPARLTQTPRSTLRNSHFPDSPNPSLEHNIPTPLDKEGSQIRALHPMGAVGYAT